MKKLGVMVAVVAAAMFAAPAAHADHKGKISWMNPEKGFAEAKKTGKPMMLFFSASW